MSIQNLSRPGAKAGAGKTSALRLIGDSLPMKTLRRTMEKVVKVANMAATNAPVLITGETGTGKELVARIIHGLSTRSAAPFVAVNCAALPKGLFQAELFGYRAGAFTDARQGQAGRIEAAHGGVLFLDEIGDLSLEMQVVLLRFLEEGTYEKLGSNQPTQADVCVIAATHEDLEAACKEGRFRKDLYFRLNAMRIRIPPLRARGDDVIAIADRFMAEYCAEMSLREHWISQPAREALRHHHWPGNVRELRNRVLRALVLCEGRKLSPQDLGLENAGEASGGSEAPCASLQECRWKAEHRALQQALNAADGNVKSAAALLDISRAHIYRLMKEHGLKPD